MKKISLAAISCIIGALSLFAKAAPADSSGYEKRKLRVEEVSILSSFYRQDGNRSPVTGGIGSEQLNDYANIIELKLAKTGKKDLKHGIGIDLGIDHYTSASSERIVDVSTTSSASASVSNNDTRYYPSLSYSIGSEKKGIEAGIDYAFSKEFDYISHGIGVSLTRTSKDQNREFGLKLNAYIDQVSLVLPSEFRPAGGDDGHDDDRVQEDDDDGEGGGNNYAKSPRNTISGSFSYAQVLTKRIQMAFLADLVYQEGFLSTPFHRVYFTDNTHGLESLPGKRLKLPLGLRANFFLGDRIIIRSYYRFYYDTWGLIANTASIEVPVKITPFISFSPIYRIHKQNGVRYYHPYGQADAASQYYTTDDDLSPLISHFVGLGMRFGGAEGVFKLKHWNLVELRYGHYFRSDGLQSDIVSMNLKFK